MKHRCISCGRFMDEDLYEARVERGMAPICWMELRGMGYGGHDFVAFWRRVLDGKAWRDIRSGTVRWEP